MSITGNILYEYSMDETLAKYREVPNLSKHDFISKLIPGDIILGKTAETDPGITGLGDFKSMMLREFQKSPVNSSKMYVGNGNIVGFGVIPGASGSEGVRQIKISLYMDAQRRVVCVRPKNYTKDQRMRAVAYTKRRMGLGYDNSMILKSAWHRFTKKHINMDIDPDSPILYDIKTPLICSAMIAFAIIYSGNKTRFGPNPFEVWPVDILMSPDVEIPFRCSRSD